MTEAKYASEVIFTKDTPQLACVFCKDLDENWLRYISTALYLQAWWS